MPDPSDRGQLEVRVVSAPVAKKTTTVRIDEDLRQHLQQMAEERGVSEAEIIRQAIVFYLGWLEGQRSRP
jgi:predicted transcriptional regulator